MKTKLQVSKFFMGLQVALVVLTAVNASGQCVLPAKPASIKPTGGNTKVCPGSTKTYSSAAVTGATSYLWTPPAGGNIMSGQGTITVVINYTSGFTANDSLKVAAVNSCGSGPNRALLISRNNPALTGAFTGPSTGFCNLSGVAYSVPDIANITFNWSFNVAGATITSGLGTHAITVDFTPSFNMGILGVSTTNACGTSGEHHLHMKASPVAPAIINGSTSVCANQQGVAYSIAAVASASTYTWTGPTGSHISDGVTTSASTSLTTDSTAVTVNFGTKAGAVKARGNNVCGAGTTKSLTVAMNCRLQNNLQEKLFSMSCYPIPTTNELNIVFSSDFEQTNTIRVFDILGNTVLKSNNHSSAGENNFAIDVSNISRGIYMVEVVNGNERTTKKIVLE